MAGSLITFTTSTASAVKRIIPPVGQDSYTTPGTYTWVAPVGVTSVSVVCVGGGAGQTTVNGEYSAYGGAGGGLGYKNNISVVPGQSYTVVVGAGGAADTSGGNSYFIGTSTVAGFRGALTTGGTYTGDGGGNGGGGGLQGTYGGERGVGGGGGAGGYSGNGGKGGDMNIPGDSGNGGGGGGGGGREYGGAGGGGGVGILGAGSSGGGGTYYASAASGGGAGSGGSDGGYGGQNGAGGAGGSYGGGAGGRSRNSSGNTTSVAAGGAVRIIYPGTTRTFPSTNTTDQ